VRITDAARTALSALLEENPGLVARLVFEGFG
jgi:hypothetical protein